MKYPFAVAALFLILACGGEKPSAPGAAAAASSDTAAGSAPYFPVMNFLKGEIAEVDSMPVGIRKYIIRGAKKDSGYISLEEFHRLATVFLTQELSDSLFHREFKETSFFDKSSNAATFLYTAKNDSVSLKRVDVVSARGDVYDKVKSVYLQKSFRSGDTGITQKMYWRPQRSFQVITQRSAGKGEPTTEITDVVWDNRD